MAAREQMMRLQMQQQQQQQQQQQHLYALTDQRLGHAVHKVDTFSADPFAQQRASEWRFFPPQPRSTSGSTASSTSNPRSASPALSTTSAHTSASASSSHQHPPRVLNDITARDLALYPRTSKKKRLLGQDRYNICAYAAKNPGIKQEEIAAQFGVERSTVSKILKNKIR